MDRKKKPARDTEGQRLLYMRAVGLVGGGAVDKLTEAGLAIVDRAELQAYQAETGEQVGRLQALVVAAMAATGTRGFLFEVLRSKDGERVQFVLCDPGGDEEAMIRRILATMGIEAQPSPVGVDAPVGHAENVPRAPDSAEPPK